MPLIYGLTEDDLILSGIWNLFLLNSEDLDNELCDLLYDFCKPLPKNQISNLKSLLHNFKSLILTEYNNYNPNDSYLSLFFDVIIDFEL